MHEGIRGFLLRFIDVKKQGLLLYVLRPNKHLSLEMSFFKATIGVRGEEQAPDKHDQILGTTKWSRPGMADCLDMMIGVGSMQHSYRVSHNYRNMLILICYNSLNSFSNDINFFGLIS